MNNSENNKIEKISLYVEWKLIQSTQDIYIGQIRVPMIDLYIIKIGDNVLCSDLGETVVITYYLENKDHIYLYHGDVNLGYINIRTCETFLHSIKYEKQINFAARIAVCNNCDKHKILTDVDSDIPDSQENYYVPCCTKSTRINGDYQFQYSNFDSTSRPIYKGRVNVLSAITTPIPDWCPGFEPK